MHIHSRTRYFPLTWILSFVAFAVGCISPAVHKNVPAFANAVTLATENTKSAFDAVEQQYENVEAERVVVNYDKQGFNPNMVKRFLGPEDLELRLALLDALQRYASTLSDVSGDKQLDQFDDKTRALGSSLQANRNSGVSEAGHLFSSRGQYCHCRRQRLGTLVYRAKTTTEVAATDRRDAGTGKKDC